MSSPYDFQSAAALDGQIADLGPRFVRSLRNDSGLDKPFGIAVTRGTADNDFDEVDHTDDEVIGVIAHSHAFDVHGLADGNGVAAGAVAGVVAQGVVYVQVEEAVTPADDVYVRFANGVADATKVTKGAFRKSADTGTAKRLMGARFLTSAAAGEVAQVWFVAPDSALGVDVAGLSADLDGVDSAVTALEPYKPGVVADPGDAGAIPVTASGVVALVTTEAGGETRTLAAPTFAGQAMTLSLDTDGGDCVVTVAGGVNVTGNNTLTLDNAGEVIGLAAVSVGGALKWRIAHNDGVGLTTVG